MTARLAGLLATAALAGCSWQGPPLAGYPGLQWQVISFYGGRAMEANATCPNPRMRSITSTRVVEETPKRVVMDIHYYWIDDTLNVELGTGGSTSCQDRGERIFTFARRSDGGLEVLSMTGPQSSA